MEEERKLLKDAEANLKDAFGSLSAEALKSNSTEFLKLAETKFSGFSGDAVNELEARKTAIEKLVSPLAEVLNKYKENLQSIESSRQSAYGELTAKLQVFSATGDALRKETSDLVAALRRPGVRGRWGELTLKRVAELGGMAEHCDFGLQETVDTEEGQLRPDMTVHMPRGLDIPVDAKVPLDAYLDAMSAGSDEDKRKRYLQSHAACVRQRMKALSSKEYFKQFPNAPEFTVLFLPGEPFFSAAVEYDPSLFEDAIQSKILIASPMTLLALLKAISNGWRQEALAENAQQISELGKELYRRVATMVEHIEGLRSSLDEAVKAFNRAVGSFEGRFLPFARRFKELGATTDESIELLEPIENVPRPLSEVAVAELTTAKDETTP